MALKLLVVHLPGISGMNDLYQFDPKNLNWTALVGSGEASIWPEQRVQLGFAEQAGQLYVFGGAKVGPG
jgi:hypothetical protein